MELECTIVRSPRRRKLPITVERDRSVVVHAPSGTPEEKIHQVVDARRQWIFSKIRDAQKYDDLPHPPGKEPVNGESALYLGQSYPIEIAATDSGEIEFSQTFFVPPDQAGRKLEIFRGWYVARAEEKILPRVRYYARHSSASSLHKPESWTTATAGVHVRPTTTLPSTGDWSKHRCR